jgi:hypothetical protein
MAVLQAVRLPLLSPCEDVGALSVPPSDACTPPSPTLPLPCPSCSCSWTVWLNQCVGERNYKWFLAYLVVRAAFATWPLFLPLPAHHATGLSNPCFCVCDFPALRPTAGMFQTHSILLVYGAVALVCILLTEVLGLTCTVFGCGAVYGRCVYAAWSRSVLREIACLTRYCASRSTATTCWVPPSFGRTQGRRWRPPTLSCCRLWAISPALHPSALPPHTPPPSPLEWRPRHAPPTPLAHPVPPPRVAFCDLDPIYHHQRSTSCTARSRLWGSPCLPP